MIVSGLKTETVRVEISDSEITHIVTSGVSLDTAFRGMWQSFIKMTLGPNYDPDSFIDSDGNWYYTTSEGWGHYETDTKHIVRKATDEELQFKNKIRELEEIAMLIKIQTSTTR